MAPVIRIDDEVMTELKKRAIELGLVFEPPNATLRRVLGLALEHFVAGVASTTEVPVDPGAKMASKDEGESMKRAATLVIHAPRYQVGKKSFEAVFSSRTGVGYIIYDRDKSRLQVPGSNVVLLANDLKRRAEGCLIKLTPTTKTKSGRQRYDVLVDKWTEVVFKPERLNRCGIAII
ncbi:MAG: hypothetical protein NTZ04_01135 [Chloroflexi bacterium]|nr:hypothetical protein [Chloroflexota bacterium]